MQCLLVYYHGLAKEHPWVAYFTSWPMRGIGALSTIMYNGATSLESSSPDGMQYSEQQQATANVVYL